MLINSTERKIESSFVEVELPGLGLGFAEAELPRLGLAVAEAELPGLGLALAEAEYPRSGPTLEFTCGFRMTQEISLFSVLTRKALPLVGLFVSRFSFSVSGPSLRKAMALVRLSVSRSPFLISRALLRKLKEM